MLGAHPGCPDADIEAQPLPSTSEALPIHTHSRSPFPSYDIFQKTDKRDSASTYSSHYGDECSCSDSTKSAEEKSPHIGSSPHTENDDEEPDTLAAYLFKFGFLFPPLWIAGAYIICSPLSAPPASDDLPWLPGKTDAEKEAALERMRTAELKWARRCLWALVAFVLIFLVVGLAIWAITKA